jgi:integrase
LAAEFKRLRSEIFGLLLEKPLTLAESQWKIFNAQLALLATIETWATPLRGSDMTSRRHFGTVRKRSSGRWQAVYRLEGRMYSAGVHATKADALAFLSTVETDLRRGAWIDPGVGKTKLSTYAEEWLKQRNDLAVRTKELYAYLLYHYILPSLGSSTLAALAPSKIRSWHAELSREHASTAAKSYRLLSTILRTAVTDGLLLSSPCRVAGAGVERSAERPVATVQEVEALKDAMPEHMALLVLLATWCQLRRGELFGLRRKDIDLDTATLRIEQSRIITLSGKSLVKEPKTAAGRRTIAVPEFLISNVAQHLKRFTGHEPESLVFTGITGVPLTAGVLQVAWQRARTKVGRMDLHFHDLRHTGLTLAATTGATTVELMHRAGHSSADAAMRYQHATKDRDRTIAEALDKIAKRAD